MEHSTGSYILWQRALALKGQLWIGSGIGMAVTVTLTVKDWSDRRAARETRILVLGFIVLQFSLIDCSWLIGCSSCAVLCCVQFLILFVQ